MTAELHIPRYAVRIEKRMRLRLLLQQAQSVIADLAATRTRLDTIETGTR